MGALRIVLSCRRTRACSAGASPQSGPVTVDLTVRSPMIGFLNWATRPLMPACKSITKWRSVSSTPFMLKAVVASTCRRWSRVINMIVARTWRSGCPHDSASVASNFRMALTQSRTDLSRFVRSTTTADADVRTTMTAISMTMPIRRQRLSTLLGS